ncbi:hypothetical protein GCM10023310_70850 [Paenibacillus vulneris]|uniref:Uncharacterized protein n=1 Tax=Paenibacillus vulneris TaxID=1133364 RepID=A0ABW3UGW9_9BACL
MTTETKAKFTAIISNLKSEGFKVGSLKASDIMTITPVIQNRSKVVDGEFVHYSVESGTLLEMFFDLENGETMGSIIFNVNTYEITKVIVKGKDSKKYRNYYVSLMTDLFNAIVKFAITAPVSNSQEILEDEAIATESCQVVQNEEIAITATNQTSTGFSKSGTMYTNNIDELWAKQLLQEIAGYQEWVNDGFMVEHALYQIQKLQKLYNSIINKTYKSKESIESIHLDLNKHNSA